MEDPQLFGRNHGIVLPVFHVKVNQVGVIEKRNFDPVN
jgi:hypothetical protein